MLTSGKTAALLCFLALILAFSMATAVIVYLFSDSTILIALSLILVIALFTLIGNRIMASAEFSVTYLLDEQCDPEAYLAEYDSYYGKVPDNALLLEKRAERLNKAMALIALGNISEAKRLMDEIDPLKIRERSAHQFFYYDNLAAIAASEGDIEKIGYCLRILERGGFEKISQDSVDFSIKFYNAKLLSLIGNMSESRERFEALLSVPASTMLRLNILYNLALIDIELNNAKSAEAYLSIVANEGNTLFIAQDARQKLIDLDSLESIGQI